MTRTVLEMTAEDFEKAIENKLSQIVIDSILSPFDGNLISAPAACEILGIHVTTLYRYIGAGKLAPVNHKAKADYKFNLRMILEFKMNKRWKSSKNFSMNYIQDSQSHA